VSDENEGDYLKPRPCYLPPMSAETWRTMDERLFRSLMSPSFTAIVSLEASAVIEARAKSLGIR